METCSNHKKEVAGISDMKVLAEAIGDLHYESLVYLFNNLSIKFSNDSKKDTSAGKADLGIELMIMSDHMEESFVTAIRIYKICKPFMGDSNKKEE